MSNFFVSTLRRAPYTEQSVRKTPIMELIEVNHRVKYFSV